MKNRYLFIIWNRALFCKDKIIKDLEENFIIIKKFYIKWDGDKFNKNIRALYSNKISNIYRKRIAIGNDIFCVLLIEDKSSNDKEINRNVYERKWKYRKWTAGNFRIHASLTENETKHDLTVLLGANYNEEITKLSDESMLSINTKGIIGFDSICDISECIKNIADSIVNNRDDDIFVFSKEKDSIIDFLGIQNRINSNICINNKNYLLHIYGEGEELPLGFIEKAKENNKIIDDFILISDEYNNFISRKENTITNIFMDQYLFDASTCFKNKPVKNNESIWSFIKNEIKLSLVKMFG